MDKFVPSPEEHINNFEVSLLVAILNDSVLAAILNNSSTYVDLTDLTSVN